MILATPQPADPFASIYPSMSATPKLDADALYPSMPKSAPEPPKAADPALASLYPSMSPAKAPPPAPGAARAPTAVASAPTTAPVPAAAGEAPAPIPAAYRDLALPEGYQLDAATFAGVASDFQRLNVSREQAQELLGVHARIERQREARIERELAQQDRQWREATERALQPADRATLRTIQATMPAEVRAILNSTGLGNHPGLVQWIAGLARGGQRGGSR
jgi:hypothetical protein